jgi:hypothetical protein
MQLTAQKKAAPFLVEPSAYEGVRRIAEKVTGDVEKVSGVRPKIIGAWDVEKAGDVRPEALDSCGVGKPRRFREVVLCATLGKSPLLDRLAAEGKFDPAPLAGKREVYGIRLVKKPWEGAEEALVICGSDKRGTIYGLFALSEYIGVSALCYWGDVEPLRRDEITVRRNIETVSKEPSVKYRGFFINDEWPCFGSWTFSHFGGFNARMYDHVFELLLRLKGNYLWPAMWRSSFPLDGPGSLNEELADLYGVVIGFSHHEPCLRASEEWDLVRGKESVYGNEWNFLTNREGLTRYWADALKRSGKYEHLITIGMRGEHDSSVLDATLERNIHLLKDVITVQRKLIREHVSPDPAKTPQLLALYKEVESFFYGDETVAGLKDWEELTQVILMLCEDNFGFLRTLPTEELREQMAKRGCGFGMYYHFDYHGSPVSYEWLPSTPFSKTWEQMCMAYDYGIREVWIVNVGDLKGNEVALEYFLTLAYDFDTWGSSAPNSWEAYTARWLRRNFPGVEEGIREQIGQVLTQFVDMNGMRRPEALHSGVYHPCHYLETDRMLHWARRIEQTNEAVYRKLGEERYAEAAKAYYSMIYYPAKASVNLLRMHLLAGKNAHYAMQGKTVANEFAQKTADCIREDRRLMEEFASFREGKWKGMELEQHIGFVTWNEDNCRYPLRMLVEPSYKPRMTVSRKDREEIAVKRYGRPMAILVDDFLYEGKEEVCLEIANDGIGELTYEITGGADWLGVFPRKGTVRLQQEVSLRCDRARLGEETRTARLLIRDTETAVAVEIQAKAAAATAPAEAVAAQAAVGGFEPMTFLPERGIVTIEASHYARSRPTSRGGFLELRGYGRSGQGMKVFPTTESFTEDEEVPTLVYRFLAEAPGQYQVEIWTAPTNSVHNRRALRVLLGAPDGSRQTVEILPSDFRAGDGSDARWSLGVLNQIRVTKTAVACVAGVQELSVGALEAGLVLERVLIYPPGRGPLPSYLGPEESRFCFVRADQPE